MFQTEKLSADLPFKTQHLKWQNTLEKYESKVCRAKKDAPVIAGKMSKMSVEEKCTVISFYVNTNMQKLEGKKHADPVLSHWC